MKNELRLGLIGAGRIGPVHAETLAFRVPQARLAAIADLKQPAAQAVASRCNIPKVVSSGREIIADPAIDAVAICSPTDTHADLIVAAARAGKHIFCEKPISLSLKEIDPRPRRGCIRRSQAAGWLQSALRLQLSAGTPGGGVRWKSARRIFFTS